LTIPIDAGILLQNRTESSPIRKEGRTLKNILLLRHGKSDWEASYTTDHDRPLAARGRSAAGLIGVFLARVGPLPQLVLTSSAVRARSTAELAKANGKWSSPIISSQDLYEAGPESIMQLVKQQKSSVETLMLVGHNPVWEDLGGLLIGGGKIRFPTGGLALIKFSTTGWEELTFGQGILVWLVTPKQLKRLI